MHTENTQRSHQHTIQETPRDQTSTPSRHHAYRQHPEITPTHHTGNTQRSNQHTIQAPSLQTTHSDHTSTPSRHHTEITLVQNPGTMPTAALRDHTSTPSRYHAYRQHPEITPTHHPGTMLTNNHGQSRHYISSYLEPMSP